MLLQCPFIYILLVLPLAVYLASQLTAPNPFSKTYHSRTSLCCSPVYSNGFFCYGFNVTKKTSFLTLFCVGLVLGISPISISISSTNIILHIWRYQRRTSFHFYVITDLYWSPHIIRFCLFYRAQNSSISTTFLE